MTDKNSISGYVYIRKGLIYAGTAFLVATLGASWGFTYKVAQSVSNIENRIEQVDQDLKRHESQPSHLNLINRRELELVVSPLKEDLQELKETNKEILRILNNK